MTGALALPMTGYAGWQLLQRTRSAQMASLKASATVQANEAYFRANIGKVTTPDQLVSDFRLLSVTLTAFGLSQDIHSKYFIRKVLADGVTDSQALSNRLADKSYHALSAAFGFGSGETVKTGDPGFAEDLLARYEARSFEAAVGEQSNSLRIALNAECSLPELAAQSTSVNSKWYAVIGSKPLASFLQGALGLPSTIASLSVDQQLGLYKAQARARFGSDDIADLGGAETIAAMTRAYLIRDQIQTGPATSAALQILQGASAQPVTAILSLRV